MYEVNSNQESINETIAWAVEEHKKGNIEAIMIVKTDRSGQIELHSVSHTVSHLEWIGILEFVKDRFKDAHSESVDDDPANSSKSKQ